MPRLFLLLAGLHAAGFGVFHLFFPRLFGWREDLAKLRPVNRSIMMVMNLCLVFVFFFLALLAFLHSNALLATSLGRAVLAGVSLFWLIRFAGQFILFSLKRILSKVLAALFLFGSMFWLMPFLLG